MLLKYSYYDHLLAISINRGNFKKAKANIDILKTYKEILEFFYEGTKTEKDLNFIAKNK